MPSRSNQNKRSRSPSNLGKVKVQKQYDEELRQATFVVLSAQPESNGGSYTTTDAHLDYYDKDTIRRAKENFVQHCMQANMLHMYGTAAFKFIENYIAPCDMYLNEQDVPEGSWLATIQVDRSEEGDAIWEGIKSGTLTGLSVQCLGTVEEI